MEGDLFKVIDLKTGLEPDDEEIALHEEWAQGLVYCDIEGWFIDSTGALMLADECGNYRYPPAGRFQIVWNEKPIPTLEQVTKERDDARHLLAEAAMVLRFCSGPVHERAMTLLREHNREIGDLEDFNSRLVAVLYDIVWSGGFNYDTELRTCSSCGHDEGKHEPDCALSKLLDEDIAREKAKEERRLPKVPTVERELIAGMASMIRDVEWGGYSYAEDRSTCPICHAYDDRPHKEDCRLKKILDEIAKWEKSHG